MRIFNKLIFIVTHYDATVGLLRKIRIFVDRDSGLDDCRLWSPVISVVNASLQMVRHHGLLLCYRRQLRGGFDNPGR